MPRHGTWQETGGNSSSGVLATVIVVAVVLIFGGGAAAAVAAAITELLIVIAVIVGVVLIAGIALAVWWLRTQPAREDQAAAVMRARLVAIEDEEHLRRLELARASAPVIQNVIDPAALLAAAFAAPHPAPYRAEVIRAEVER